MQSIRIGITAARGRTIRRNDAEKMQRLPKQRTFNQAFAERGRPGVVKLDVIRLHTRRFFVRFESANSERRQGVWLATDGGLVVNGQSCPSVDLWFDTAPAEVLCDSQSQSSRLYVYNIWQRNGKRSSLSYSSGMLVDEVSNGRRYHCNDIGFTTNFDKLVFTITWS